MRVMTKKEKLERATYNALRDYKGLKGYKIESVEHVSIYSHTPEEIGDDSMEEWESISGAAEIRTAITKQGGFSSSVSRFSFDADVEYTDEKMFNCTVSRLTGM